MFGDAIEGQCPPPFGGIVDESLRDLKFESRSDSFTVRLRRLPGAEGQLVRRTDPFGERWLVVDQLGRLEIDL